MDPTFSTFDYNYVLISNNREDCELAISFLLVSCDNLDAGLAWSF